MSNKKYKSSKGKSDEGTDGSVDEGGKTAKHKKSYDQGQRSQKLGRERQIHEEIIARRMEGGAPPSPEAYARALEQWQQLPGSVVRPPTDVLPAAKKPPKSPGASSASPPTSDDASDDEHQP
jgi:hypothetical protein